jgi:hypothetical protein
MIRSHRLNRRVTLVVAGLALTMAPYGMPALAETAVQAEKNPPGDIPDSQVFIAYKAPAGASMKVPEGWSRKDMPQGARFFDKYNIVELSVGNAAAAPTVATATSTEAAQLATSGHAVKVGAIKPVKLPGGIGVVIEYSANSEPNTVTGKPIRLEAARYLIFRNGKLATLDLEAPAGADNVDQWRLMAASVRLN